MLSMFPLMSPFVLLLLEFWVHAFLEFAEDLARNTNQYSCPTLSKDTKGHNLSLTSSPESSGSAIEAQWFRGRAPYGVQLAQHGRGLPRIIGICKRRHQPCHGSLSRTILSTCT